MKALVLVVLAVGVFATTSAAAGPPPNDSGPLPTIGGRSSVSRIEPRFSEVATRLVGRVVEVRCWNQADWSRLDDEWRAWANQPINGLMGYTHKSDPSRLHLSPRACRALVSFVYRKARPKQKTAAKLEIADAIVTLAHEAQHLAGIADEAMAECRGQQLVRPVARILGASRDYAAGLALLSWTKLYPNLPESYRSPECRDDGEWDVNPSTATWP